MTRAYSEVYLEDAMRTLGEAVDFALCDQGLTPTELTAILSNAFEMKQFERGIPRVVCGMSGDELAREIIVHAGLKPVEFREAYPFDRSPQYWAGWVLAYTQWTCGLGFSDLFEVAPLDWVIGSYHPLHEASEVKFAQIVIDKWNKAQAGQKGPQGSTKGSRPDPKAAGRPIGSQNPCHTALRAKPTGPAPCLGILGIGARKNLTLQHRRPRLATDRS